MVFDNAESYTSDLDPRVRLMRRRAPLLSLFLTVASGGVLYASPPPPPPPLGGPPISGVVSHMERPIADALVVLYNLQESTLTRSHTATDGTFVMVSAPVGVYDLIAIKKGYRPALQRVWHQSDPQRLSAVHIELAALGPEAKQKPVTDNLWELRDQLPVDILREIAFEAETPAKTANNRLGSSMGGEVQAASDLAASSTSLARTAVGLT